MQSKAKHWSTLALVIGALMVMAPNVIADTDDDKVPWYKAFNGHEMWMTNLDNALELSGKENRPLLIDIYSRH